MTTTNSPQVGTVIEPGTWIFDASHSSIEFVARHLMVTKVRGHFANVEGTITIAEKPLESSVRASVEVASVLSGDDKRDEHLRSSDFFEVDKYPTIDFVSTNVVDVGDGHYELIGDLTVHGVTRPVTWDLQYEGTVKDPWGGTRAGFSASVDVNRKDWGLTWNVALETGGFVVSDKVHLNLEVEAVKQ
ncbi:MAG: polyisoprenoid-binding protein [Actinomycetia bacterium]|jgi:polyisoprenoid-binding protein YceI|nr:polyisoprenoid-binding protein [Actinomycetes bacterium]